MTQLNAIEENILVYYWGIARLLGGQVVEQDHVTWFTTGRQSSIRFNGVLRTAIPPGIDLKGIVDPILDVYFSQKLPFFWVDWPVMGTPDLGDYLSRMETPLLRFSIPAMSRPLNGFPPISLPKEVDIVRVQTQVDQVDWLNVWMAGFAEPESARPYYQAFLVNSLSEPQPVFQHFLARWQGEPCAISTLLCARLGAGIYHVATLPAFRGRGLGQALTLTAMQTAQQAGYRQAILFATSAGYPLYVHMGFETVTTAILYIGNSHE